MRDLFPGYYRPSDAEFKKMWDEGVVSVDANILLHIYRYSEPLCDALYALFEKLKGRLWVPHRVAFEFSKNRLTVIAGQERAYDTVCEVLEKATEVVKSQLPPRHPVIDIDELKESFQAAVVKKQEAVRALKSKHPKVPDDDPAFAKLSSILDGHIGGAFTADREQKLIEEGKKRFDAKIPPGFRDAGKEDDSLHRYGDLLVWRQLLEHVKTEGAAFVLFATDDSSDDWWWKQGGKTIGPHPLLVEEAKREANARAYLYRGDQFIKYGCAHFKIRTKKELIHEAVKVRQSIRRDAPVARISTGNIVRAMRLLHRGSTPLENTFQWAMQIRKRFGTTDQPDFDRILHERFGLPSCDLILSVAQRPDLRGLQQADLNELLRTHQSESSGNLQNLFLPDVPEATAEG